MGFFWDLGVSQQEGGRGRGYVSRCKPFFGPMSYHADDEDFFFLVLGSFFCISVKEVFTHYAHMFTLRDCWDRHD